MLFVFNRGGLADSNGFADSNGAESFPALIVRELEDECADAERVERLWAREFRYDGPRQRYLVRELDPDTLAPILTADVWTDYLGDVPVLDFRKDANGDEQRLAGYLPGVAQTDLATGHTYYLHGDHLGSTWYLSENDGGFSLSRTAVRTAFGENVSVAAGPQTRYGCAGAWGYQEHDFASPADPDTPDGYPDSTFRASPTAGFPFQHVGWRYDDPGSGRFLQQDPIGIRGGLNVYEYAASRPTTYIDPAGLSFVDDLVDNTGKGAAIGGSVGGAAGGVAGGIAGSGVPGAGTLAGVGAGAVAGAEVGAVSGALCGAAYTVGGLLTPVVDWLYAPLFRTRPDSPPSRTKPRQSRWRRERPAYWPEGVPSNTAPYDPKVSP